MSAEKTRVSGLNPRYTFDTFVTGSSNRLPHAAAQAAADRIGTRYNPLFIYGPTGLGKTHLMHAIGHRAMDLYPDCVVNYVSSELFTDEFIHGIRTGNDGMSSFKNKYRRTDVLLIDDIHFLAGRESTLDEFYHTFNILYESNKQIVMTSDRPPHEINPIEARLKSRFSSGVIADISPPDLEMRIAILRNKADQDGILLPADCSLYIADHVTTNIRELEGALNRLVMFAEVNRVAISYDSCVEALSPILPQRGRRVITIELIQEKVADAFQMRVADLCSKKRSRDVSVPKQIAMYLCRELTEESFVQIGKKFDGKHHTTVMYAHSEIANALRSSFNPQLSLQVKKIIEDLESD